MDKQMRDITTLKYYEVTKKNPVIMKLETSKRKKLYHYTNEIGAKGILKSNSLWVTHSNFLDDTTEIKYISIVLDGVIMYLNQNKELYDMGITGQVYIYEAIIKTLEALRETYKEGAPIDGGNLFLLSLTENKNNKYLFENYCRQGGAVLEFRNNIHDMFKENKYIFPICSAKVVYDCAKQMTVILEDINEFYSELLNTLINKKAVDYMEMIETVKSIITIKIINYSFFFKHIRFSKEEEYRVVFLVEEDYNYGVVKHRTKSAREIPYIEANFKKKSLIKARFI
ncbi:DUF2971 domain-containing protein [Clostridium sporogenes]|uniref:DUF2971 domain-containing protein n=2 Tax=Clostridium sporogenes TaxID=1509 RepID=UPI000717934A|nr:DUF2971 domain-containing protein [Clostridium sporogenes]MBY7063987.1 DUF2971 domain-containing protein [Clostridium sporogenes]MBY7069542.1 DUF2971 domain-containing protein [Clostridium sporogenes]MCW6063601.1 hypothetical protein [Clostridium sporogenes]